MASYEDLAEVYDEVYSWKDYARESARIQALLAHEGVRHGAALLDVGCGTGSHLVHLARWFRVTGLDPSPRMLSRARRKVPRGRFVRGRMQTFRLPQRFDAILCLFSTIGYVRSSSEMRETLRNLVRHLAPAGVLLLEPWIEPSQFLARHVHLLTVDRPELKIARATASRREGEHSILEMHYLVARPGAVEHFRERHVMTLVPIAQVRSWLEAEGLSVHTFSRGFTGRGLIIARRRTTRRR